MRAVNLMPGDSRAGGSARATGSSSSYGAYAILGILGGLVVFAALWTVTNKQIDSRTAKLEKVNVEAKAAEQRASASAPYQQFAELARNRKATVTSLSATRFDWAHGLREVARVVPDDVWLSGITGTSGASDAAPSPTSNVAPAPEFEMTGCTTSQAKVARLMARLRAVDGVRSVVLKTSTKPDSSGGDDCPANKPSDPVFTITISFAVPGEAKATVDSTGQISAPAPVSTTGAAAPAPAPAAAPPAAAPAPAPTPAKDAAR